MGNATPRLVWARHGDPF